MTLDGFFETAIDFARLHRVDETLDDRNTAQPGAKFLAVAAHGDHRGAFLHVPPAQRRADAARRAEYDANLPGLHDDPL